MRMFLVGMCDIFLLLYLTALAEVDARQVSDLTVKDYISLKESEEDLKAKYEEAAVAAKDQEQRAREAAERAERLQKEIAAASDREKSLRKIEEERARLQAQSERRAQELAGVAAERAKEIEAAKARERDLAQQSESEKLRAEKALADLDAKRLALEDQERRARDALAEAERQKAAAAEAVARASAAEQREKEAVLAAEDAKQARAKALEYAGTAIEKAQGIHTDAERALQRAQEADREKERASLQLKAVTQPVGRAIQSNVLGKVQKVSVNIVRRGLLGESGTDFSFSLVPVATSRGTYVFVPLSQLGLETESDVSSLEKIELGGGVPGDAIVSPGALRLVGFPCIAKQSAAPPLEVSSPSALMPTLIAVRNGSRPGFSTRIRGISESTFAFQRDRLQMLAGPTFRYAASGFRGTGDFAEQIITGDQIVDLNGAFLGVATNENTIRTISDVGTWRSQSLRDSASLSQLFD